MKVLYKRDEGAMRQDVYFLLLTWEWFTSRLQDGLLTDSFEWRTLFPGSSALLLFIYGPLSSLA